MGTPWAATWDAGWAASVAAVEAELGRRVCGAKTLAGTPCSLSSEHRTGRCPFHGGTDAIGAPVGNSNARVHGLYARRLQRCGTHCPMWDHCPFASADVLALPLPERPVCAYEAAEYDEVLEALSDGDSEEPPAEGGNGFSLPKDLRSKSGSAATTSAGSHESATTFSFSKEKVGLHNLALLQVMVSRAAAALSVTTLTDTTTSESDRYRLESTKVHAALDAFLRLSREHRAVLKDVSRAVESAAAAAAEQENADPPAPLFDAPFLNPHATSLAEWVEPLLAKSEGIMEEAIAVENQQRAYTRRLENVVERQLGPDWREDPDLRGYVPIPAPGAALNIPEVPPP